MNKIIRLTENDLHKIVKQSVKNIISEIGRPSYAQKKYDKATRDEIIANSQAEVDSLRAEIAILSKKIRAAKSPEAKEQLKLKRSQLYKLRNQAVSKVWNLSNERVMTQGAKDRAREYRKKIYPGRYTSTSTLSIENVVRDSIVSMLKEEELGGTSSFSVNSPAGSGLGGKDPTGQGHNKIDFPFGGVQRRKGYSPKGSKESKMTEVDVNPATKRHDGQCGSISIPKHRVGESIKGRKNEVNEGWFKNAAMAGAMGAASMFGGVKANAQNVVPQSNDTVQITKNGGIGLGNRLRNKGYSENDVQQTAKTFNPSNIMTRNAKGGVNSEISKFLSSLNNVSSSMSTDSIKVFNGAEANKRMKYLGRFNENNAKKYKLFFDANENAFLMPINYTLNDVQKELGTFQLGDFDIQ